MKSSLIFLLMTTTLAGCSFFAKHPNDIHTIEQIAKEAIDEAEIIDSEIVKEKPLL